MAEQSPNFTLQKATIPFEADTQALDLQLDAVERRLDQIASRFKDMFSSSETFRALDERLDRLEKLVSGGSDGYVDSGPTVTSENGVSITPVTPTNPAMNDIVQMADDVGQIRLDVQAMLGAITSGGVGA